MKVNLQTFPSKGNVHIFFKWKRDFEAELREIMEHSIKRRKDWPRYFDGKKDLIKEILGSEEV